MANKISILSTKKLLTNQKEVLLNADFDLTEAEFIRVTQKDFQLETVNDNLIFTSQNAVHSILNHPKCDALKSKNVFCVGLKTKNLLKDNGFNVIAYTGYAADLAEIITLIYGTEKYTFFSGNLRRDTLPEALKENNILFNEIEVYETSLTPQKINSKPDAIMFFSPSGVESYLSSNSISKELCFAIGETTAEALENKKIKNIIVAERPTIEDLISEVIHEYK